MSELSRGVPSALSLVAESARRYRAGFPGVARAFLPVFGVFAVAQIGFALAGDPIDFGGLVRRGLALAIVGLVILAAQLVATGGFVASAESLGSASVRAIYRAGMRAFWPLVWSAALSALALSAAPAVGLLVAPYVVRAAAFVGGAGDTFEAFLTGGIVGLAILALFCLAAALVVLEKVIFVLPVVVADRARGIRSVERSAGLSEGRAWAVAGRLLAGLVATTLLALPFALLAAVPQIGSAAPALLVAGHLLVVVPFAAIFLTRLAAALEDTRAERAVARASRPWVRLAVWVGLGAWVLWLLTLLF